MTLYVNRVVYMCVHKNTEGAIKNGQSRETGNTEHTGRRKTKQKHNTIYIGHHYTQWPKEKRQKTNNYLQNSTHKTKDRVTRTSLKTGNELMCSGRVSSSCSINGTRHVTIITNSMISHE